MPANVSLFGRDHGIAVLAAAGVTLAIAVGWWWWWGKARKKAAERAWFRQENERLARECEERAAVLLADALAAADADAKRAEKLRWEAQQQRARARAFRSSRV